MDYLDTSLSSVKVNVAGILRDEIISGRLEAGARIIEARWATKLKVAKTSVREALNILAVEGFVEREANRSPRVTSLSNDDVLQAYEVRTSLESLAARLVAAKRPDLADLDQAIADMYSAVQCGSIRAYYERALRFHLMLCEKSGNRFILEYVRRLMVPLFAFIVLRKHAAMEDPERCRNGCDDHTRILAAVRSGDPDFAESEVAAVIKSFSEKTLDLLAIPRLPTEVIPGREEVRV